MKDYSKFAIVDHVGKIKHGDGSDFTDAEFKGLYKKVFKLAVDAGYSNDRENPTVISMKNFCRMHWKSKKTLTDAKLKEMKFAMRYNENVERVYFICPTLRKDTEQELRKWFDRGIPVTVIDTQNDEIFDYNKLYATTSSVDNTDFYRESNFNWDGSIKIGHRLIAIWGAAIDDNLNALPAYRIQDSLVPENYIERTERKQMRISGVESSETHFTKPFSSAKSYLSQVRCVETDENVRRRLSQLFEYAKLAGGRIVTTIGDDFGKFINAEDPEHPYSIELMNEFLECDWIICPDCLYPHCTRNHKDRFQHIHLGSVCEECDTEFDDATFETDRFFEDGNEPGTSDDYLDEGEDKELTEEEYWNNLKEEWDI